MARVIYKYPLVMVSEQYLLLPSARKILHVGEQDGRLQVWAMVDPCEIPCDSVQFYVMATGEELVFPFANTTYLGTVQKQNELVYHVFYK